MAATLERGGREDQGDGLDSNVTQKLVAFLVPFVLHPKHPCSG